MAKIKAPIPITGLHVSVPFVDGWGETKNEWLIEWFAAHGYEVIEDEAKKVQQKATGRKSNK